MTDIVRRKSGPSGSEHAPCAEPEGIICLSCADYRRRVLGCWTGKSIGGTLGQPYEGVPGPLALSFYEPVPQESIPNDDLDLQIVWLQLMRQKGLDITSEDLAQAWIDTVEFEVEEYAVALGNLRRGIFPPLSGNWRNYFGDQMGAPIRSEIWAAIAPGDPVLASKLAFQDAIVDHDSEGVWGEVFWAAIESAAFAIQDRDSLINIGLAAIDPSCRLYQAITDTLNWCRQSGDWLEIRQKILNEHGSNQYTYVPMGVAFTILGWLRGKDSASSLCTTVNCGQDADCTGATLGAVLGITNPNGFGEKWLEPISNKLVVSPSYRHLNPPETLTELTDITCDLGRQMLLKNSSAVRIGDRISLPTDLAQTYMKSLKQNCLDLRKDQNCIVHQVGDISIRAEYPKGPSVTPGTQLPLNLEFRNKSDTPTRLRVNAQPPPDLQLDQGQSWLLDLPETTSQKVSLTVSAANSIPMLQYLNLELKERALGTCVRLPVLSNWPWTIRTARSVSALENARPQLMWLGERQILPADNIQLPDGGAICARISFATVTPRRLCLLIGTNSAAKVRLNQQLVMDYSRGHFLGLGEDTIKQADGGIERVQRRKVHQCEIHQACFEWVWHELEITAWNFSSNPRVVTWFTDHYTQEHVTDIMFRPI